MNNETIIIKSKSHKTGLIALLVFVITIMLSFGTLLIHSLIKFPTGTYTYYHPILGYTTGHRTWTPLNMIDSFENIWFIVIPLLVIGIILSILTIFMKSELVVSDKRIYGKASFGRRVDLPFDSVSAVASGFPAGIRISTASGRVAFLFVHNRNDIYRAVCNLLIERQGNQQKTVENHPQLPQDNTAELKKYKELLDEGVITQEEFDAKKKQLLGL